MIAMTYLIALGLCIAAAAVEGLCAGRDPMKQLKALKQPRWSPPAWGWVLIGIGWYGLCFTALVRLLPLWPGHRTPIVLLCTLMLANGAVNILQFRMRRLDLSFFSLAPYWALLAAFLWAVCPLDPPVCALFGVYAVYQLYAAAWQYQLWRMNGK
jgi:tryptophan-rich sensory protein